MLEKHAGRIKWTETSSNILGKTGCHLHESGTKFYFFLREEKRKGRMGEGRKEEDQNTIQEL